MIFTMYLYGTQTRTTPRMEGRVQVLQIGNLPLISSISTCVAPRFSTSFCLIASGVTPELAALRAASSSVRALMIAAFSLSTKSWSSDLVSL